VKERLTGAIILVVLIVLLVPELLSGPRRSSVPAPGVSASSSEEPPLKSYTINLGDESRTRAAANGGNGPAMPQLNGPEQPSTQSGAIPGQAEQVASQPPATSDSTHVSSPTAQASSSTTASAPGISPQPSRPAANPAPTSAATNAASSHSATSSSQATPPSGSRQTGAASGRSAQASNPSHSDSRSANASASKSNNAAAAPRSASTAPSTPTSKSESGWAVQLGVFHSRENAERMALEARVKGFKASVSSSVSHSQKLYRVRVGPVADRAAAQELQSRLKASGRPGGAVVPIS
jgi:DedD protein